MWYSETLGTIKTPRALTVNGIQHPSNIFRAWSSQELADIGIYPARVDAPDSRYWNTGAESIFLAVVSAAYAEVARKQTMSSLKVSTIPRL